jgi:hypothetical protein
MLLKISHGLVIYLIFMLPNYSSAEMFKWVDEQGRVHYGDKPHDATAAIKIKSKQDRHSGSVKPINTNRVKPKTVKNASGLSDEQWVKEQVEKQKNWSYEDYEQYQADLLLKEEEDRQHIVVQIEAEEIEREKESAKRKEEYRAYMEMKAKADRRNLESRYGLDDTNQYPVNEKGYFVDANGNEIDNILNRNRRLAKQMKAEERREKKRMKRFRKMH